MIPKELRRRADKRCGSDDASLRNATSYTNHRFTLRNRKPPTQNHHRRKRFPLRASIENSRSHPTPFNPITEIEASRDPTPLTAVELRSPTYEISTHPTNPEPKQTLKRNLGTKNGKAKQRNTFTPRDLDRRRQSCGSLHLAGTGTGVDGAEEASTSRRQTKETERKTSPRLPHHIRALTPETGPPWMALFQSSGKAVGRGDKTEAEINSFAGG
ncbi:hypothetical protein HID58_093946 [Brassica napus]|uniref:Uncharacterized protein n=1 Tax=Brassica napus TaxID=3708 RepID=A0ABQ7X9E1_BRANA|nr:hypothetical protein HID58_091800 [Brassica napus]KAH0852563.1 hypothetical protein HID58_093946 [Brassica napus]